MYCPILLQYRTNWRWLRFVEIRFEIVLSVSSLPILLQGLPTRGSQESSAHATLQKCGHTFEEGRQDDQRIELLPLNG
jgi:hypothetical protein